MRAVLNCCPFLLILAFGLRTSDAAAQMLIDPASVKGNGRSGMALTLQASNIDYENRNNTEIEIERKILGAEIAHGLASNIDGVAQIGFIMDSEMERVSQEGDGFVVGFGLRALLHRSGRMGVTTYGLFNWQREDFNDDNWELELETYDLHLGAMVLHAVSTKIVPYAGLDLVVVTDGTAKTKIGALESKDDFERDNVFALKLGVNILAGSVTLRPEATLIGEQTFTFAAGFGI